MADGIKKEFVIDSSDSAKPPVTLQDEPRYFSDIKPKKRVVSDIIYEDTGEVAKTRKGKAVKLILKTSIYDDNTIVTTTVGEENEAYQEFLRTGVAIAEKRDLSTAVHERSSAVEKALAANKKAAVAVVKKTSSKE
jgi:hypothetical protein